MGRRGEKNGFKLEWTWDPWVAQQFGACLWPRVRSWRLNPGSPGSHPGPKAGAKLLRHPGIPSSFKFEPILFSSPSHVLGICYYILYPFCVCEFLDWFLQKYSFLLLLCFLPLYCHFWPLLSTQRVPFNISCKAGLVVMNSFTSCLSGKLCVSPSILTDSVTG